MKPIIILPPDSMSDADIAELRANDICVVTSKEPAKVEFVDPIPSISSRTQIENAAIGLCRKILRPNFWNSTGSWNGSTVSGTVLQTYIEMLVEGSPLDPKASKEELGRKASEEAYFDERRRIAREEARAERAAAKKKIEAEATKKKPSTAA